MKMLKSLRMQPAVTVKPNRIESIDILRGLIMIIMALDHTRDFFHPKAWTEDAVNLATTTPVLYFTRWITHFCAPCFVFLSGASAYLQSLRKTKKELSAFLIKRGFWLILVELIIINFIFSFDIKYSVIGLQVIWVIGLGMMILGLAIWLPFPVTFILGVLIVGGHNLLDFYERNHTGSFPVWYDLLHRPNLIPTDYGFDLFILYPFLSWLGLILLGYCFGKILSGTEGAKRKKLLITIGSGLILLFILLRGINVYGNPFPWSAQKNNLFTFLSFMNVTKYPPSLLFMCITIGPALVFMAFFETARNRITKIISVYGRVPFFYYILHFLLIHLLCAVFFFIRGHSLAESEPVNDFFPYFIIPGEGYSLPVIYILWIAIVASLYPLCKWYDGYKTRHKEKWWLSYL